MENIKVIELLSTFSKEEFEEFEKFIDVSFLSSPRNLKPLFKIIKKYYGDFKNEKFTFKNITLELFGKEKTGEKSVRTLFSDLYKSAKNFLVVKEALSDKILYDKIIVSRLLERRLDVEFKRHLRNAEQNIEEQNDNRENYYKPKAELEYLKTSFLDDKKDYDAYKDSYQNLMRYRSLSFLIDLLKDYPEYIVYKNQNVLNYDFNIFGFLFESIDFEKIINESKELSETERTILKLFYLTSILEQKKSFELYQELKKLFLDNYEQLSRAQKKVIFVRIFNYLYLTAPENFNAYSEIFEINEIYLDDKDNLFLENNFFNKRNFRSTVIVALALGKNEWTINFINKYKKYLPEEEGENLVNHNLALAYFRMKDYDKSLEILSRVKFNFGTYKEDISLLKTIVLYEKGLYQEALDNVQALKRTFKKTSVMTKSFYEMFKNSIIFFIKFLNIILKQKYTELDYFEQQLKECQNISVKPWMLGKISELKKLP